MVRVRLLGGWDGLFPGGELEVAAQGVRELMIRLAEIGASRAARLFPLGCAGEPLPEADLTVLVNGRDVDFLRGWDTELGEGDRVTVYRYGGRGFPGG